MNEVQAAQLEWEYENRKMLAVLKALQANLVDVMLNIAAEAFDK